MADPARVAPRMEAMVMNLDEGCPACEAPKKAVQPFGPEVQGARWFVCDCCSVPCLVRVTDGEVLRTGKP